MASPLTVSQKWRFASVMVGGLLIHLSLGTLYTFGNLNPYITSYMRNTGSAPSLTSTECSWVFALSGLGQGFAMFFGGLLEQKVGLRLASLIGCWLMSLGVFLTYFSVQHSFGAVIVTYGLMFGLGTGLAYALPLSCAMKWMPHRKGLMNGVIVAGFGGGAFVFDQVQMAFINPNDEKLEVDGDKYFANVPKVFILLGGCYAVMQLIGCLLLANPPFSDESSLLSQDAEEHNSNSYHQLDEQDVVNGTTSGNSGVRDYSPMEMVKTKSFYLIFLCFFFLGQGITIVSGLYKAYGLTFISNDSFLSWTGGFASLFNGLGRIFWGLLADRFSCKTAVLLMTSAFTCLLLTFQFSKVAGEAMFFIYVCLLFGVFSGSFSLFPTLTTKCFGQKHMAKNYGLVFISLALASVIGVFASFKLQASIGWVGVYFYTAGSAFLSFICIIFFNAKDKYGRDI